MGSSGNREMKKLLHYTLSNCTPGQTQASQLDPEKAAWLKEALSSMTVDLDKRLREDIALASSLLSDPSSNVDNLITVLEDIENLTEDINFAFDFLKLGGIQILKSLVGSEFKSLQCAAYHLLGLVTQNHEQAQKMCLEQEFLAQALEILNGKSAPVVTRSALFGLSCLVRGFPEGMVKFLEADGFSVMLHLLHELSEYTGEEKETAERAFNKTCFFIYCVLQEIPSNYLDTLQQHRLTDKIAQVVIQQSKPQEHLLASLILLLSGSTSVDYAIDNENVNSASTVAPRTRLKMSVGVTEALRQWANREDTKLNSTLDEANEEVNTFLGTLKGLLVTSNVNV